MTENELQVVNIDDAIQLKMCGEFTTRSSENIKNTLVLSTAREGRESLDLTNASAMDVAGIQLAYAWKKELEHTGRKATITLPAAENISDLFVKTGITQIL